MVQLLLEQYNDLRLLEARCAVVRTGALPEHEVLTVVGPVQVQVQVQVQVHKLRDRIGSGVNFNSALAPPYVCGSARVSAALPWLYLKRVSSGDLGEALEVAGRQSANGLSPVTSLFNLVGDLRLLFRRRSDPMLVR